MTINWQEEIEKEGVKSRKELIEILYARFLSKNKVEKYLKISHKTFMNIKKEDSPDINYYYCDECGEKTERQRSQGRKRVCDKLECQGKLKARQMDENRRRTLKTRRRQKLGRINYKKTSKSNRRECDICGCDPYPNKLRCKSCRAVTLQTVSGGIDEVYGAIF